MPKWTDEQLDAINKDNSNIIVSAGAGSGKTAVLTSRVIRKLKSGININQLLVLTFTNAAASEMKERIRKSIKEEGLLEQLDYIDSAYITTFDSYAQSLVRKYHYLLNISNTFKIVESSVLDITKKKIIDDIFENEYQNNNFKTLINSFCEKNDNLLRSTIILLNEKLDLKPDKLDYLNNYIENYYNDNNINNLIKEYEQLVIDKKNDLNDLIYNISIYADTKFMDKLNNNLQNLIQSTSYDDIRINLNVEIPRLKEAEKELTDLKKSLKNLLDNLKEMTYYTKKELKDNLLLTKDNVRVIIKLILLLDKKIEEYKTKNQMYEFNDIAKMAINIVKNNEEVRNEIKNNFNEIMIDEYQDTSNMQEAFINLIENNNVYMVGDIKQSIYRFRHANPEIFRNKYNNYSINNGGIKIDLLKNFRSREEVLFNINEIFESIMDEKIGNADYKKTHKMMYGNTMYETKAKQNYNLEILNYNKEEYKEYNNSIIEAFIIGNDIKRKINNKYQIIDKQTNNLRDFKYDDACIIMDRGTNFDTYKKVFEYLGIPLVVWQDEQLNKSMDIMIIKNIISLIVKIKKREFDKEFKYYFTSVCRSYLFEYNDNKIFNIFLTNNFYNTDVYLKCNEIAKQLDEIDNTMLLDTIIDVFNIYENTIKIGDIKKSIIRIENLRNLFASLKDLGYTPYDLPNYFKEIGDNNGKFSLNTKISGNVNLMNIHKSKGLEFSICYFSGFSSKFNDSDIKDSFIFDDKYGFIIPFYKDGIGYTILKDLFKQKYFLEDICERIRLFYVALTRAKEQMIMVTNLEENNNIYDVVPDNIRLNYRSFKDIMNSIYNKVSKHIRNINLKEENITLDYDNIKISNYKDNIGTCNTKILINELNNDINTIVESRFSKISHKLASIEEINNMKKGTEIHYILETTDFKNPNLDNKYKDFILNFINQIDTNCKIYKEYEFLYEDSNNIKHGIIDLMLEYEDHIDIIDYKLKNTLNENYKKQIKGYKEYIETISNKEVYTYLYSIIDGKKIEIK